MKLWFPFWNRISDGAKQFLAIVAIVQAVAFCISIPYGVYNQLRLEKWINDQTKYTPAKAAYLEIINELYTNSASYDPSYSYSEACNEYPSAGLGLDVCAELESLGNIVNKWTSKFELTDQELELLKNELAISARLPVTHSD